jgi:hypothetical protein
LRGESCAHRRCRPCYASAGVSHCDGLERLRSPLTVPVDPRSLTQRCWGKHCIEGRGKLGSDDRIGQRVGRTWRVHFASLSDAGKDEIADLAAAGPLLGLLPSFHREMIIRSQGFVKDATHRLHMANRFGWGRRLRNVLLRVMQFLWPLANWVSHDFALVRVENLVVSYPVQY